MSDEKVVPLFETVDVHTIGGQPRHDMAQMLRDVADRAERGEFDGMVMALSLSDGGIITGISTPEKDFYRMLGACEELKQKIFERRGSTTRDHEYNPKDES